MKQAVSTAQKSGFYGLKCLEYLLSLVPRPLDSSCNDILLSVISFSSLRDPWTSTSSHSIAARILEQYTHEVKNSELIINFLIQEIIRPLFSKSKPTAISSAGRKAMPPSVPLRGSNMSDALDPAKKPWKYTAPFSIVVFEWAVATASVRLSSRKSRNFTNQLFYRTIL